MTELEQPLVEFFRGPGERFGKHGDYEMWSPEQTAVHFLTEYLNALTKQEWPIQPTERERIVAAERERCAGIADYAVERAERDWVNPDKQDAVKQVAAEIAAGIRYGPLPELPAHMRGESEG